MPLHPLEPLSEDLTMPEEKKFQPGGIHDPNVRHFWEHVLKANAWVLDTLKHGYALPFLSTPKPVCLRNNLSARQHESFVRQEVAWLSW